MRILAFSDIHTDLAACQNLAEQSRLSSIDIAIGAGDFAVMRMSLQKTIDSLRRIECPIVLVPGNGESVEELQVACRPYPHMHVLHGTAWTFQDATFFGLGYAVPETPFGAWSCDLSEADAQALLEPCPPGSILISHSPPLGHVDVNSKGEHVGSRSVLETIHRTQPRIVLCGHVHDCWTQVSQIDSTMIYNLGPGGRVLDLV